MTFPVRFQIPLFAGNVAHKDSDTGFWNPVIGATTGDTPVIATNPDAGSFIGAGGEDLPARVLLCRSTGSGGVSNWGAAFRYVANGGTYSGGAFPLNRVKTGFWFYVPTPGEVDGSGDLNSGDIIFIHRILSTASQSRVVIALTTPTGAGNDTRLRVQLVGGSIDSTTTAVSFNEWHYMEVEYQQAAGAGTGILRLELDGVSVTMANNNHSVTNAPVALKLCADNTGMTGNTSVYFAGFYWTDDFSDTLALDNYLGAVRLGDISTTAAAVIVQQHPNLFGWANIHAAVEWGTASNLAGATTSAYVQLNSAFAYVNTNPLQMTSLAEGTNYYYRVHFSDDGLSSDAATPIYGPFRTPAIAGQKELWIVGCANDQPGSLPWFGLKMVADLKTAGAFATWPGDRGYGDQSEWAEPWDGSRNGRCQRKRMSMLDPYAQTFLRTMGCYELMDDHDIENNADANEYLGDVVTATEFDWTDGPGGAALNRNDLWVEGRAAYDALHTNHHLTPIIGATNETRQLVIGNVTFLWIDAKIDSDTDSLLGTTGAAVQAALEAVATPYLVLINGSPLFDIGSDLDDWWENTDRRAELIARILDPIEANANIVGWASCPGDRHVGMVHRRGQSLGYPKCKVEALGHPLRMAALLQTIIDDAPTGNVDFFSTNGVTGQQWTSMILRVIVDDAAGTIRTTIWDARHANYEPGSLSTAAPYADRVLFDQTYRLSGGGGGARNRSRSRARATAPGTYL